MKYWVTKNTGKGFYLLIFTLLSIMGLISMILYGDRKNHDKNIEDLLFTFLAFSPLLIGWIFIFSKFIFKKRIPVKITYDNKTFEFEFYFSNGTRHRLSQNEISYTYFEYKRYNVLIFNKKVHSKRGHIINKELISLVGLNYKFGWEKQILDNISKYLNEIGIDYFKTNDKSFIMRIIQ
jgi:hypothetical protein